MSKSAHLKLASDSPAKRSPEREALSAAIDKRDGLAERVAAIRQAKLASSRTRSALESRIETAQADVETAKKAIAKHRTAQALGKVEAAPISVKSARASLQDLQDEFDAEVFACDELDSELQQVEMAFNFAADAVVERVKAVIAADPITTQMLTRCNELRRELAEVTGALAKLSVSQALRVKFADYTPTYFEFPDLTLRKRWEEAMKALENDAGSALPSLP